MNESTKAWIAALLLSAAGIAGAEGESAVSVGAVEAAAAAALSEDAGAADEQPDTGPGVAHGEASWYGPGLHGRRTASGERFDRGALTAAHRSLPFGTLVHVENLRSGRSVAVRINDRGPHTARERIIDLSEAAARAIGLGRGHGVAPVRIKILKQPRHGS